MKKTDPQQVSIRFGKQRDIETIVEFQIAMAWETEQFKLDRETVLAGVTAAMDDPNKGQYLVAEYLDSENPNDAQHSHVVGSLLILPEWSDWRNAAVMWIHSVYVQPESRGLGIYRSMYQHLVEEVQQRKDWCGLRLYVDHSNEKAQQVYQSLGMNCEHYKLYEWMPEG